MKCPRCTHVGPLRPPRHAGHAASTARATALSGVGRAVSSTLDLETVLTTMLSRLDGGVIFEYEEAAQEFVHRAAAVTSEPGLGATFTFTIPRRR